MSPASDPLRNTLDQLALDPRAKDDRKYLVSVLRRLGYSEEEIREALGIGGEEGRLIEVEYTGKGPAIVTDELGEVPTDESGFTVVEDEPDLEHDAPVFQETDEWSEEWDDDDAWEPADEPEDDAVEFEDASGSQEPERVAFAVRRGRLDTQRIPAARGGLRPPPSEEGQRDWEPVDRPEEGARSGDVAVQAGWEPVDAEGLEEDTDEEWGAPEEAPGQSWEPVDEDAPEWDQVEDESEWSTPEDEGLDEAHETDDTSSELTEWQDAPEDAGAEETPEETWEAEPAAASEATGGAFTMDDYTLYTRDVELSTGRQQTIYFFAKSEPKSGRPAALPDGYAVERNDRTGLPYLRRTDTPQPKPDRPVYSGSKGKGGKTTSKSKKPAKAATTRCHAVTQSGSRCKNHPRENSKYCGIHKNWRGPKVD